jgi:hypothetical protein
VESEDKPREKQARAVLGAFFWVLVLVLAVAIAVRYLFMPVAA